MNHAVQKPLFAFSLAVAALICTGRASAQCADIQPQLQKQSFRAGRVASMPVSWHDDDKEPIVGFWKIVQTSKGNMPAIPDGAPIDSGLQQWHADGTEFLNSSSHSPQEQNYCLGVWEKTGASHYALNHFAYAYGANNKLAGVTSIREEVTVNREGTAFTGTFTIQPYDLLGNSLAIIKGVVTGKRIDIRTTVHDIL